MSEMIALMAPGVSVLLMLLVESLSCHVLLSLFRPISQPISMALGVSALLGVAG